MKKTTLLAFVLITILVSCKKENVNPNAKGAIDVVWRVVNADVLYDKFGGLIKYSSDGREYEMLGGSSTWNDVGTYSFGDTIFSHTSKTGYTYKALYYLSANKDTLIFRDLNYKFNYPSGGEPKDILVKQ